MKRIIEGKTYNTDTAQYICDLDCRANRGDFGWHDTKLYRSPKGQFFIAGKGGAMSMWSQPVGTNCRGGGSGIRLVDEGAARRIMEESGCTVADFLTAGLSVEEG